MWQGTNLCIGSEHALGHDLIRYKDWILPKSSSVLPSFVKDDLGLLPDERHKDQPSLCPSLCPSYRIPHPYLTKKSKDSIDNCKKWCIDHPNGSKLQQVWRTPSVQKLSTIRELCKIQWWEVWELLSLTDWHQRQGINHSLIFHSYFQEICTANNSRVRSCKLSKHLLAVRTNTPHSCLWDPGIVYRTNHPENKLWSIPVIQVTWG